MKQLARSFKQIFKKGNNGFSKILLMGLGLAAGIILISKLWFEKGYDNFPSDKNTAVGRSLAPMTSLSDDRIYIISEDYQTGNDEPMSRAMTPGGVAFNLKNYSPLIEVATRTTDIMENGTIRFLEDKTKAYKYKEAGLADTCFFEMFPVKVTGNDPKKDLDEINHIYISDRLAETMAGKGSSLSLIGSMLTCDRFPSPFEVSGIFEKFPENSTFSGVDILVSMPTISTIMWDGTKNMVGNDRYLSYIKLNKGANADDVTAAIKQMCEKELPNEKLEKAGVKLSFHIDLLSNHYGSNSSNRSISVILIILSITVLVVSVLNYILITLSAMVRKAKKIAVHKCYGAKAGNIFAIVGSDVLMQLIMAVAVAILLIIAFSQSVNYITGNSIESLFSGKMIMLTAGICIVVFILCAVLPGFAYAKIPVSTAFRGYKEGNRKWKSVLLFFQLAASTFFLTLLVIIMMQYRYLLNSDPGYKYENLAYVGLSNETNDQRSAIVDGIKALPFVEKTAFATDLPFEYASGNNIYLPGNDQELFNTADFYYVSESYFDLMGIPIIEGRLFNTNDRSEVMVNRSFADKISTMAGWEDGALGKQIFVTEHSDNPEDLFTICGIYEDYLKGSFASSDSRPSIQFHSSEILPEMLLKMHDMSSENLAQINAVIQKIYPAADMVKVYSTEFAAKYMMVRRIRDAVMMVGIIVLIITLIGLIGYLQEDLNRRRSEIAVRKINGALVSELIGLFMKKIMLLAIPAIIAGVAAAYYVGGLILSLLEKKLPLSWWIFAVSGLLTILIVATVVAIKTIRAANANPADNLRTE